MQSSAKTEVSSQRGGFSAPRGFKSGLLTGALAATAIIFGSIGLHQEIGPPYFVTCSDNSGPLISMNADDWEIEGSALILKYHDPESSYIYSLGPWVGCSAVRKNPEVEQPEQETAKPKARVIR